MVLQENVSRVVRTHPGTTLNHALQRLIDGPSGDPVEKQREFPRNGDAHGAAEIERVVVFDLRVQPVVCGLRKRGYEVDDRHVRERRHARRRLGHRLCWSLRDRPRGGGLRLCDGRRRGLSGRVGRGRYGGGRGRHGLRERRCAGAAHQCGHGERSPHRPPHERRSGRKGYARCHSRGPLPT